MRFQYFDDCLARALVGDDAGATPVMDGLLLRSQDVCAARVGTAPRLNIIVGPDGEQRLLAMARRVEAECAAAVLWADPVAARRWPLGPVIQLLEQLALDVSGDPVAREAVAAKAYLAALLPDSLRPWMQAPPTSDVFLDVEDNYLKTVENCAYVDAALDDLAWLLGVLIARRRGSAGAPTFLMAVNTQSLDRLSHRLLARFCRCLRADHVSLWMHVEALDETNPFAAFLQQLVDRGFAVLHDAGQCDRRTERDRRILDALERRRRGQPASGGASCAPQPIAKILSLLDPLERAYARILAAAEVPLALDLLEAVAVEYHGAAGGAPAANLEASVVRQALAGGSKLVCLGSEWKRAIARDMDPALHRVACKARRRALEGSDLRWQQHAEDVARNDSAQPDEAPFRIGFHAHEKLGDWASAAQWYAAVPRASGDHRSSAKLAALHIRLADLTTATQHYAQGIAACDRLFDLCFLLCQQAVTSVKRGLGGEADTMLADARACVERVSPGDERTYLAARYLNARSFREYRSKQYAAAAGTLDEALAIIRRLPPASTYRRYQYVLYKNLGRVQEAQGGRLHESILSYRRALRLCRGRQQRPNQWELLFALGRAYLKAADVARADACFRRLLAQEPGALRLSMPTQCRRIVGLYRAHGCSRETLRWQLRLARYYESQHRLYDAAAVLQQMGLQAWSDAHVSLGTFAFRRARAIVLGDPGIWDRERLLRTADDYLRHAPPSLPSAPMQPLSGA